MRYLILIGFVLGLLGPLRAEDTRWLAVTSEQPPPKLGAPQAKELREGMTLKELVVAFGPGWRSPDSGTGIIQWAFDDGRVLCMWPSSGTSAKETVITFDREKAEALGKAGVWWE